MPRKRNREEFEQYFWSRCARVGECLEWQGYRMPNGYGHVAFLGRMRLAHRVAYELTHGPIPEGMLVCHRCDNPPCTDPEHLFLGTHSDNVQDMLRKGRCRAGKYKQAQTHCKRGHPFDEENTYRTSDGRRQCKSCQRAKALRQYYKHRDRKRRVTA